MDTTGRSFVEFWAWASNKGLMNKNTAQSLATASKKVVSIDENWETIEISTLDVNELLHRFRNLRNKDFKPASLQVYERRFKQALELFLSYAKDPANWKYQGQVSANRKTKASNKRDIRTPDSDIHQYTSQLSTTVPMVDYPYPLRENCIVRMKLPVDLKVSDIDRIMAFLKTLVIDTNLNSDNY